MSVSCVRVHRLCVPNIMSLCVCFKKLNLVKVGAFAWCSVKIHVFTVSGLKEEKLIKKQTYMKTEARKLYSRVFWTFLPNDAKIDPYNFELYRFKVITFFETQCSYSNSLTFSRWICFKTNHSRRSTKHLSDKCNCPIPSQRSKGAGTQIFKNSGRGTNIFNFRNPHSIIWLLSCLYEPLHASLFSAGFGQHATIMCR